MTPEQSSHLDLSILAWGASTPLGNTIHESALAYRAGTSALTESSVLTPSGETPTIALLPTLEPHLNPQARRSALLEAALEDARKKLSELHPQLPLIGRSLKIYLLLDEPFEAEEEGIGEALRQSLLLWGTNMTQMSVAVSVRYTGPAGLGQIMLDTRKAFDAQQIDLALVCSCHSDHEPGRMARLEQDLRIHAAGSLDGILLGEGAGATFLLSGGLMSHFKVNAPLKIKAFHHAQAQALINNDEAAYLATGMTVAARQASEAHFAQAKKIGWLSSDISHELFRVKELQTIMTRLQKRLQEPQVLDTPNQRIGSLGAAVGLWQIAYAAEAWALGFAPAPSKLCTVGSDSGVRLAFLLEATHLT